MSAKLPSIDATTAAVVGNAGSSFWLFNPEVGWDLNHPQSPDDAPLPLARRLTLATTTSPITIDPAKTALIVIDMQNLFLSPAMGRSPGPGHDAEKVLLSTAFPAAREAGIRIVHIIWGINDEELAVLPPTIFKTFGYKQTPAADHERGERYDEKEGTMDVGRDMGTLKFPDSTTVSAGRALMRGQWNTALYDGMQKSFDESQDTPMPQVRFHKNRLSGFWAGSGGVVDYLRKHNITTLLFTGVNTDQCVLASLQDACNLGFDIILLKDACGTSSPEYARVMVEFNVRKSWGFVSTCKDLADAVKAARQTVSL